MDFRLSFSSFCVHRTSGWIKNARNNAQTSDISDDAEIARTQTQVKHIIDIAHILVLLITQIVSHFPMKQYIIEKNAYEAANVMGGNSIEIIALFDSRRNTPGHETA